MIRCAHISDVPTIGRIVNDAAEYGLMLHRSPAYLYENVRDFRMVVHDDQIVGVCGLKIVWANLAEVYALAVGADYRGRGIGKQLVQACLDEAEQLGVRKVMALTYEKTFFQKLGFEVVDREQLPLKVWGECVRCSKNAACDEIALVKVLEEVPPVEVPKPSAPAAGRYVVPVTVTLATNRSQQRQKMDEAP